jgi:hypothetical protein
MVLEYISCTLGYISCILDYISFTLDYISCILDCVSFTLGYISFILALLLMHTRLHLIHIGLHLMHTRTSHNLIHIRGLHFTPLGYNASWLEYFHPHSRVCKRFSLFFGMNQFFLSCRLSASRELDRNVKGYKELRRDLAQVTFT